MEPHTPIQWWDIVRSGLECSMVKGNQVSPGGSSLCPTYLPRETVRGQQHFFLDLASYYQWLVEGFATIEETLKKGFTKDKSFWSVTDNLFGSYFDT